MRFKPPPAVGSGLEKAQIQLKSQGAEVEEPPLRKLPREPVHAGSFSAPTRLQVRLAVPGNASQAEASRHTNPCPTPFCRCVWLPLSSSFTAPFTHNTHRPNSPITHIASFTHITHRPPRCAAAPASPPQRWKRTGERFGWTF